MSKESIQRTIKSAHQSFKYYENKVGAKSAGITINKINGMTPGLACAKILAERKEKKRHSVIQAFRNMRTVASLERDLGWNKVASFTMILMWILGPFLLALNAVMLVLPNKAVKSYKTQIRAFNKKMEELIDDDNVLEIINQQKNGGVD